MRLVLVLAFVVVPLVELAVLLQVGDLIGLGPTLLLLLAVSVLGAVLVRREGSRAWRAFRQAVVSGRPPAREVADGAMLLVGGTLLLTPGFVTDVAGLVLVVPPTRSLLRRHVTGFVARRLLVQALGDLGPVAGRRTERSGPRGGVPPRPERADGVGDGVVEGEVVDRREPGANPGS